MTDAITAHPILANLFRQNQWANLVTIDACAAADEAIIDADAPGTVGTIRRTLWHIAESENHFLAALNGEPDAAGLPALAGSGGDLTALRGHMERIGDELSGWAQGVGSDTMLTGVWDDGPYHVPASMFAAQAIFHGTTHRWQIGEALERLGVEAPDTDAWSWWESGAATNEGRG